MNPEMPSDLDPDVMELTQHPSPDEPDNERRCEFIIRYADDPACRDYEIRAQSRLWEGELPPEHEQLPLFGVTLESGHWLFEHLSVSKPGSPLVLEQRFEGERVIQRTLSLPLETLTKAQWGNHLDTAFVMMELIGTLLENGRGRPPEQDEQDRYAVMMLDRYNENPGARTWTGVYQWFSNETGVVRSPKTYEAWVSAYRRRNVE